MPAGKQGCRRYENCRMEKMQNGKMQNGKMQNGKMQNGKMQNEKNAEWKIPGEQVYSAILPAEDEIRDK